MTNVSPAELTDREKAYVLLDWLESLFPDILSPSPQPTIDDGFVFYRYYPNTDVATGTIGENLYYLDNQQELHDLGKVNFWLDHALGLD